ncbi:hypothetical protein DBZ36_19925 [Alginatibacterium sediminis]|uniref:Uncharacterized protein n=1 Tax=Alginatibacterium sediminis TaxID=2164068 RepID=A0A420E650_9ALTE|nr:hypothetical protein [Alginatibacterium sediminis]RKF13329.1 hypothetical protein DBZ36_19925 [Alginatibacterium sediminis]
MGNVRSPHVGFCAADMDVGSRAMQEHIAVSAYTQKPFRVSDRVCRVFGAWQAKLGFREATLRANVARESRQFIAPIVVPQTRNFYSVGLMQFG